MSTPSSAPSRLPEWIAGIIAALLIVGTIGIVALRYAHVGSLAWLTSIAGTHHTLYAETDAWGRVHVSDTDSGNDTYAFRGRALNESEKAIELQIFDFAKSNTTAYIPAKKALIKKCADGKCASGEWKGLSYLASLEGDYADALKAARASCAKNEMNCATAIELTVSGVVKKQDGAPLPSATVVVMGDTSVAPAVTNEKGAYTLIFHTFDLARVRLQATKKGYTDATIPFDTIGLPTTYVLKDIDFKLAAPARSVIIDTAKKTTIGEGATVDATGFVVTTARSRYTIPFDAVTHRDGTPFVGEAEAFLFEFDKSSVDYLHNLLANDTFDDVAGYAGNIMKTFGMPYIKFIAKDGETLHVRKSHPMVLNYRLPEMEALRTNKDHIYQPLTDADLTFLIAETKQRDGYPIDRQFLIDHALVRFPAFWDFDQVRGVWENIGVRVLSHDGDLESLFYTLNDQHSL